MPDFTFDDLQALLKKQGGGGESRPGGGKTGVVQLHLDAGQSAWNPASTKHDIWGPAELRYDFHLAGIDVFLEQLG